MPPWRALAGVAVAEQAQQERVGNMHPSAWQACGCGCCQQAQVQVQVQVQRRPLAA